jgi:hypothetical protein
MIQEVMLFHIQRDQMDTWHMNLGMLGLGAHIKELDAGVRLKDGLEFVWLDARHKKLSTLMNRIPSIQIRLFSQ